MDRIIMKKSLLFTILVLSSIPAFGMEDTLSMRPIAEKFTYFHHIQKLRDLALIAVSLEELRERPKPDYMYSEAVKAQKNMSRFSGRISLDKYVITERLFTGEISKRTVFHDYACTKLLLEHADLTQNLLNKILLSADNNECGVEILNLLLKAGAQGAFFSRWEKEPLHNAVVRNDLATVKRIVQADATAADNQVYLYTPLELAAQYGLIDILQELVKYANQKNKDAALCRATRWGTHISLKPLINNGAAVNTTARDIMFNEYTPLHIAVTKNFLETAKILLELGADSNARIPHSDFGRETTPLLLAVRLENREMAKLLIEHGAEVNAYASDGTTSLDIALSHENAEMVNLLKEHDAKTFAQLGDMAAQRFVQETQPSSRNI